MSEFPTRVPGNVRENLHSDASARTWSILRKQLPVNSSGRTSRNAHVPTIIDLRELALEKTPETAAPIRRMERGIWGFLAGTREWRDAEGNCFCENASGVVPLFAFPEASIHPQDALHSNPKIAQA